jgi:uncharacterized protein (TIGR03083 family)
MAPRTFAPWVEPVAAALADGRAQVIDFARSAPPEIWGRASGVEGWTNRDVLAHLAGGNDRVLQLVLQGVTERRPLDPSLMNPDTDQENARGVEERRSWPIERLIADLERDGDDVQELLSRLTDMDRDLREPGFPITLGEFLHVVQEEGHDMLHLAQMRSALSR